MSLEHLLVPENKERLNSKNDGDAPCLKDTEAHSTGAPTGQTQNNLTTKTNDRNAWKSNP